MFVLYGSGASVGYVRQTIAAISAVLKRPEVDQVTFFKKHRFGGA